MKNKLLAYIPFLRLLSVFVLLSIAGTLSSCGKRAEKEEDGPLLSDGHICAKVENSSEYSNVAEVKLEGFDFDTYSPVMLASGDWEDGGFTIALPKTLAPNYLHPLISGDWLGILAWKTIYYAPLTVIDKLSGITISNENVKLMSAEFWGVNKDGYSVAVSFSPVKVIDEDNYTRAIFTYVDSDVTISGFTGTRNDFGNPPFEIHNIYSIEWEKGWNVWYLSKSRTIIDGTPILIEQWSTTPVCRLKWYGETKPLRL